LADARGDAQRYARLAGALADARGRQRAIDHRLARAVELSRAAHGALSVRALANAVGIGERQLERLFGERIGIRPKLFARLAGLERALGWLATSGERHAELAARAGYSDEAHFAREVHALSGLWPSELAHERRVGFVQATAERAR